MKTRIHFPLALILLSLTLSCAKEELTPGIQNEYESADKTAGKSFNNGEVSSYQPETLIRWNELLAGAIDNKLPLPLESRIYVMVTIAMHDALNNVVPLYETYALDNSSVDAGWISKENITFVADAAVSQAAYDVITALFTAATPSAEALLTEVLSQIPDGVSKDKGVETGHLAAQALFLKRQGDFPLLFTAYIPESNEPGVYQANYPPYAFPNPPIWPANGIYAPNLGDMTPFGIASADQFLGESPYAVDSPEYAKDYNEIKALGCLDCLDRSAEQTGVALFWLENIASGINRLGRTLTSQFDLNGWEAARLLALLEMGVMDSFIASFREKAEFVYWAPITAIRAGEEDGNPETQGDLSWTALRVTPPVYEFPSTLSYGAGAASEIFRLFFKKEQVSFTVTSPYTLPGVERSFSNWTDYSKEQSSARIFLGHHYRYSVDVGEQHGLALGNYVFKNNFRKLNKVK